MIIDFKKHSIILSVAAMLLFAAIAFVILTDPLKSPETWVEKEVRISNVESDFGKTETLQKTSYTTNGRDFYITSNEIEAELDNFAKLINQARMVPYFKKSQHKGYQIKAIDKGSLYEKLGFKNNDVIEEINGDPLDSMEKVMGTFKRLRNEREFSVNVQRKGVPLFFNIHIN